MRRWIPLVLILLIPACGDDEPLRPTEAPDPPAILSVTFTPDSVLVDTVVVAVTAERADSVSLWRGETLAAVDAEAPFQLAWDSREARNGTHDLTIRAANASGHADTTLSRLVVNLGRGALVTVSPADTMVQAGETVRFTAVVLGEENTAVTWRTEVAEDVPIDAGPGTVDETGLYTAPDPVPEGAEVRVTATSVADPAGSASARVTLDTPIRIAILSVPKAVRPGLMYPLSALVAGTRYDRVSWSVLEGPAHGTIHGTTYMAPPVMPDPPRVTLVAKSVFYPLLPDTSLTIPFEHPANINFLSAPAEIYIGETYQVAAEVVGIEDARAVLSIDEGPAHGALDATGLYTAPATRPVPSEVTFRATSVADPAITASVTVPIRSTVQIGILEHRSWAILDRSLQLGALVTGTQDTRVRWSVVGGFAFGRIDQNGVYTAPSALPPEPRRVMVQATSLADTLERSTTTLTLYGPVIVDAGPDTVEVALGDRLQFSATVANSPSPDVTWTQDYGAGFGHIDDTGVYTAPAAMPDPPHTVVSAHSVVDRPAGDSVTILFSEVPPAAQLARMLEMYHGTYEVTRLAEQVTGIVVTALSFAEYLSGGSTRGGTLYQNASGWTLAPADGDYLEVVPEHGRSMLIEFTNVDGMIPYQDTSFRYVRGVEFKGELDCTIQVGSRFHTTLHLTNSSASRWGMAKPNCPCPDEGVYTRTLQGRIPGAEGGNWDLDVTLRGEMWDCYDSTPTSDWGVSQSLSGAFTTPAGFAITAEDSFSVQSTSRSIHMTSHRESFGGNFSVTEPLNTYTWSGLSFFWYWTEDGPQEFEDWHAAGTVEKNGGPYGFVRFDRPVTPDMTTFPRPLVDFGPAAVVFLDRYSFNFNDPTGPALSPFLDYN